MEINKDAHTVSIISKIEKNVVLYNYSIISIKKIYTSFKFLYHKLL